jgi:molecular chaperone GrpE
MSILGDGGVVPAGDGPDEDVELLRFQRDRYLEDLQRIAAERDRYFAELETLHGAVDTLRRRLEDVGVAADLPAEVAGLTPPSAVGEEVLSEAALQAERDLLLLELERERDGYLEDVRRVTAEFQNFRKQTERRNAEVADSAKGDLVAALLPVLDACDAALQQGATQVEPVANALRAALEKEGMTVIAPTGQPFDPNLHEAVLHEPAAPGEEPVVLDTLRLGYAWRERVVRAALVKVRS